MPGVQNFPTSSATSIIQCRMHAGIHKYEESAYKIWSPGVCTPADLCQPFRFQFSFCLSGCPPPPLRSPTLLILVHVSREIRWPRRAACKKKGVFRVLVGKHEGKSRLVGAKIDGKRRQIAGCGLDSSCLGYRPVVGCCEHGNERAGSVKCGESFFLISWGNVSLSRTLIDGVSYVTENTRHCFQVRQLCCVENSNMGI
jgi:hypothetical protein